MEVQSDGLPFSVPVLARLPVTPTPHDSSVLFFLDNMHGCLIGFFILVGID
jgi:hypothetical protein